MSLLCGVALPFAWFGFADKRPRSDDYLIQHMRNKFE
jgi:hypothetical protein